MSEPALLTNEPARPFQHYSPSNIQVDCQEEKFTITFSRSFITRDVKEARDGAQKALAIRLPQLALRYVNQDTTLSPQQREVVSALLSFAERINNPPHRSPVDDPKQRFDANQGEGPGLLDIIDKMRQDPSYIFGPREQKPGEVGPKSRDPMAVESRFICVFCHAIFTRTGDLLAHLRKNHTRDGIDANGRNLKGADLEDIVAIFRPKPGQPNRLYVFGRYTYEDVKLNNWEIKDWTVKVHRAPRSVDEAMMTTNPLRRSRKGDRLLQRQFLVPHAQGVNRASSSVNRHLNNLPYISPSTNLAIQHDDLLLTRSPFSSEPLLQIGSHLRRKSPVPILNQLPQSSPPDMRYLRLSLLSLTDWRAPPLGELQYSASASDASS